MKKLKKINLELNKEVISSLSGNEMNSAKGGAETLIAGSQCMSNVIAICTTNPQTKNGVGCEGSGLCVNPKTYDCAINTIQQTCQGTSCNGLFCIMSEDDTCVTRIGTSCNVICQINY